MSGKFFTGLCLCLALALLLTQGCTKKPKINLSDLRNTPAGAGARGLGGGPDSGFVPGGESVFSGSLFDPAGALTGDEALGSSVADGATWAGTDQPVGSLAGENFLSDAQTWDKVVYFAYDSAEVAPGERYKLDELAKTLQNTPTYGLVIEGHCDDRGSDEYNRGLSERRALSVREYLQLLGIADERMMTISYGEDRPAINNASSESEHQKNRRAEFLLGTKK